MVVTKQSLAYYSYKTNTYRGSITMNRIKEHIHQSLLIKHFGKGIYQGVQELDNGYDELQFNFRGYHINYIRFDRDDQEVIVHNQNKATIIPVLGLTEARNAILEAVDQLEQLGV